MKSHQIKLMCLAGVLAAVVFVCTAYFHIPVHTGYVHVGDAFIYLAACLLPLPYAAFVGVAGALLSDLLTGFALWAPASLLIKAGTAFCFSSKKARVISGRNLAALVPACVLCVGGYCLYEAVITGSFAAPAAGVLGNVMQSLASSVLFVLLGLATDRLTNKKSFSA